MAQEIICYFIQVLTQAYMKEGEYLFKSRKGENRPITTVQAYRIISEAAKE